MTLLIGKVAAITGAAQGLGFAIAEAFVGEGARVVIGDVDLEAARNAAERLGGAELATGARCDVTVATEVQEFLEQAVRRFGALDIMVNNAGITRDATMRTMTEEQFDQVIATHLKGTWNGTRLAGAIMRNQQGGSIINMSSLSGKVGMFGQTNYSAAKAGIVGLSKAAAKEFARHDVRVNVLQPGLIRSPMTEALRPDIWDAKVTEVPMQRVGEPTEVASVALFYASDMSSYMTGTVAEITGGRFM